MLARAFLLLFITVTACIPQLLMSDWRGTEGRRVQIALEMARAGEWMVPTLGGEPTWAKPPLHYWLLGAVAEFVGNEPWVLRLPSVLGLFGTAWLAMELLRRWFGSAAGWVGALGVICAPLAMFEWATAEIDPLFACFTATSLWCLATGIARGNGAMVLVSGLLGGLAMLQKGPPYLIFAVGAYLVWWRRRGLRFAMHHFVALIGVPLCYFVPLWLWHISPSEMFAVARDETVGRISYFEWEHLLKTPVFWLRAVAVQLPLVLWCFWEWRGTRDARMDESDLTLRICSGAAVFAIVILTVFPGRPTRYLLPNVPLFIFAVAPAVAHFASQRRALGALSKMALRVFGAISAVGLILLPFFVERWGLAVAGILAIGGVAHLVVRSPRQLVAFVLIMPVLAAWTAGFDRARSYANSSRATGPVGEVLRRELEAMADTSGLATHGHVDSKMLLGAGLLPPGHESARRPPTAPWLLTQVGGFVGELPANYVDRLWISSSRGVFRLHQRKPQ